MEKVPACECLYLRRTLQLLLSVFVDDTLMAGEAQEIPKMWATSQKQVDLEDQYHSLTRYISAGT